MYIVYWKARDVKVSSHHAVNRGATINNDIL